MEERAVVVDVRPVRVEQLLPEVRGRELKMEARAVVVFLEQQLDDRGRLVRLVSDVGAGNVGLGELADGAR